MNRTDNIVRCMTDPKIFGKWFKDLETWRAWIVFLRALFGLGMTEEEAETFRKHTGRENPPTQPMKEAWVICGRRGGKSFITAMVGAFKAAFVDWRPYLTPGETGVVMIVAENRRQAKIIKKYISAFFQNVPLLRPMVVNETQESIELSNSITIEIHACSYRSTRGPTIVCALLDEVAFWRDENSADPDKEVLNAIRPGTASIPDAMIIGLSSPYAKRGLLYEMHRDYFGKDDDEVLVWKGTSLEMNPSLSARTIEKAFERDPVSARTEFDAEFRSDIETFIDRETIERLVIPGLKVRPPIQGVCYASFVDPAGGSGQDSMTLGIAHSEGEKVCLDLLLERKPPFSPDAVVKEFSDTLKQYGLHRTTGDRYSAEWVRERFLQHGIFYEVNEYNRSEIYIEALPMFTCGTVELLDNEKLVSQFAGLERRTGRGKDIVDHPPRSHDDLSNVVAGCLVEAQEGSGSGLDPGGIQVVSREQANAWREEHLWEIDRTPAPWDAPRWHPDYIPCLPADDD